MGRMGTLRSPISISTAVALVKSHLSLNHLRLAEAAGTVFHSITIHIQYLIYIYKMHSNE